MADLPVERSLATPPFTSVGMDVFGHWMITFGKATRGSKSSRKCWALLFTCLSSRAVHVESLLAMDTVSFINAFRRFTSLRGPCVSVFSDRGSNFIGAKAQTSQVSTEVVGRQLSALGVVWKMNPPHASNFGGIWERKIGQMRRCLDSTLLATGERPLCFDELNTLLQEAAAIVNSTPLWDTSFDPNDPSPVTPYNLLTQKFGSPTHMPGVTDADILAYGPRRWKRVQLLADHFWEAWRKRYLLELNSRDKWRSKKQPLQVGDVVLVREQNCRRSCWPTGMIQTINTSHDGRIRSATVRMALGRNSGDKGPRHLERPASEMVVLMRGRDD